MANETTETVEIMSVTDTEKKTKAGERILKVKLMDGREGTAFDDNFMGLDLVQPWPIKVRDKGLFNGKPDLVFNLANPEKTPAKPGPGVVIPMAKETFQVSKPSLEAPIILKAEPGQSHVDSPKYEVKTDPDKVPLAREQKYSEHVLQNSPVAQPPKTGTSQSLIPWVKALDEAQSKYLALTGIKAQAQIEAGFAMQALEENPELKECTPESITNSVINIARTGMTLNPALQLGYLIRREKKGKPTCCLEFSYRGLVKILKDYGCVRDIQAIIVYEDETYEEGISQTDRPTHVKKYAKSEEEENSRVVLGIYCRVILPGDNLTIFTPLTPLWKLTKSQKASKVKDKSKSAWTNWYHEMLQKTKLKLDFKTLISGSPKKEALAAMEVVADNEEGFTDSTVVDSRPIKGVVPDEVKASLKRTGKGKKTEKA